MVYTQNIQIYIKSFLSTYLWLTLQASVAQKTNLVVE